MSDVVADVNSGEITYAVRDTTVNGVEIKRMTTSEFITTKSQFQLTQD